MPPPDKPCSFDTAGLSADEISEIDPDYLYFLRHVRPEGRAYAVEIPSKDGSSRPLVVRYEKPLAAPNAEPPAVGSEGGTRHVSSPMEDDSSASVEVPSSAASPPAGLDGEARGGAVPVEGDGLLSPKAVPAWYDSVSNMDEDYRFFLQHSRVVNDSQWVFEMGNFSMTFGEAPSVANCEDDDGDEEEEDEEGEVEEVEAVSTSGDNSARTVEENKMEDEMPVVVGSKWPTVKALDIETEVKEEVEGAVKNEEEDKESGKIEGMDTAGSDIQMLNVVEVEMKVGVDEEEEQSLNSVMRTPGLEPSNRETSSRQGAMPCNASELEGIIWPAHIIGRPESDFKRKLLKVLIKPFNREEYDELFAMATDRTPVIKERRTRRRVMYYSWEHEMGKSYFDSYPDLADQVEGQNSYPNRLALLRGFFFWLENVGHDEQFRPWSADYKRYRVFYSM